MTLKKTCFCVKGLISETVSAKAKQYLYGVSARSQLTLVNNKLLKIIFLNASTGAVGFPLQLKIISAVSDCPIYISSISPVHKEYEF